MPFSQEAFDSALHCAGESLQSFLKKGVESDAYDAVRGDLDGDKSMKHQTSGHKFDFYMAKWRKHTVHFCDHEDEADYCVLTSKLLHENICCWMGKVRDAFIGELCNGSNEFESLTADHGSYSTTFLGLE